MTFSPVAQFYGPNAQAARYYDPATGSSVVAGGGINPNNGKEGAAIAGFNPMTGNAIAAGGVVDPINQTAKGAVGVANAYTGDWAYLMGEVDKAAGTGSLQGAASNGAVLDASKDSDGSSHFYLDSQNLDVNLQNGSGTIENHKTGRTIILS